MQEIELLVPDTSILIEGLVSHKIKKKQFKVQKVIIHEAVIAELEHQANQGKAIGFLGLDEIKRIKLLSEEKGFELEYLGNRPKAVEIKYATLGEIDAMIRQLAWEQGATLITSDHVQSRVAEAKGMKVIFFKPESAIRKLKLEKFFDKETMSVHLREEVQPVAKKGRPGGWKFVALRKKVLSQEEVQDISREIIEDAKLRHDGFIEIERAGSTIVQLGLYRIVITKPPFSDGWEITAVRPVRRLTLEDYKLSEKLMERIGEQAEGVLVAGAPGMGKSTFAQAISEFYASKDKIVKTVEAPRDLILPESITQYAISHGDAQEIHDILLLSRPDYTIFDEMRNTNDFKLFADMRLAGVGMVGVVHATNPIDAIQRFLGRVEMGVIPQIIDTVIFIKNGGIDRVLSLNMTVKVPTGMTEADLARPVVVVNNFEDNQLEYEIYTYGEQTVVIPVKDAAGQKTGAQKLASEHVEKFFSNIVDNVKVDVVSDHKAVVYVPEKDISKIIGRQGKRITEIEKQLGLSIDIQELTPEQKVSPSGNKGAVGFESQITKKHLIFFLDTAYKYKDVDIFLNDEFILTAKVGKTGCIKLNKKNKMARMLAEAVSKKEDVKLVVG